MTKATGLMFHCSFTILALAACKMGSSAKNSNGSDAGLASITMKDVSQSALAHDKFSVDVRDGNGQLLNSFSQPKDLAAQKFKANTVVMLGVKLYQGTSIVAKTTDGSKTCPPITKTLNAGNNSFQIPLCKSGSTGNDTNDTVVTPPADNSNANVDVQPCIAGSSDCAAGTITPNAPGNGGVSAGGIGGPCLKDDGVWKTANGGCQHIPTGLTVSPAGHSNGTPYNMTHSAAETYCVAPWKLPSRAEFDSLKGSDLHSHVQYYKTSSWEFWTRDPNPNNAKQFYTQQGYATDESESRSALCLR